VNRNAHRNTSTIRTMVTEIYGGGDGKERMEGLVSPGGNIPTQGV